MDTKHKSSDKVETATFVSMPSDPIALQRMGTLPRKEAADGQTECELRCTFGDPRLCAIMLDELSAWKKGHPMSIGLQFTATWLPDPVDSRILEWYIPSTAKDELHVFFRSSAKLAFHEHVQRFFGRTLMRFGPNNITMKEVNPWMPCFRLYQWPNFNAEPALQRALCCFYLTHDYILGTVDAMKNKEIGNVVKKLDEVLKGPRRMVEVFR